MGSQMVGSSSQLCKLIEKPSNCPQESFDKLNEVWFGELCPDQDQVIDISIQPVGGVGGLPPAYLSVPNHRDCMGSKMVGGSSQLCKLIEKPSSCPQESFDKLNEVWFGELCPGQDEGEKTFTILGGVGGLPPAYLSVPNHRDCMGSQMVGSSSQLCKLIKKPSSCPQESFDKLNEVWFGELCPDQDQGDDVWIQPVGGVGGLPPAYLSVPNYQVCMGSEMSGSSSHLCLLLQKPLNCPDESFHKLHQVFKGGVCRDQNMKRIIGGIGGTPPAYLSVPKFKDCLGSHKKGSSMHLCSLIQKPDGCPQESYDKLLEVFDGDLCDNQPGLPHADNFPALGGARALPPAYLSVPNHRDCLGSHKRGSSMHLCSLIQKPENCPQESFDKLLEVFEGDLCDNQPGLPHADNFPVLGGKSSLPPAYLTVPQYKDCLGSHKKGSSMHLCLLIQKPEPCPQKSFDELNRVFEGDICNNQPGLPHADIFPVLGGESSLPPAYLTVPQYKDCLGSHKRGSSMHLCSLIQKPEECPQKSFDKLLEVFEGDLCDNQPGLPHADVFPVLGRDSLPPAYLSVEGWADCLRGFQASGSHEEQCLPENKPNGCSMEAFGKLRDIIFNSSPEEPYICGGPFCGNPEEIINEEGLYQEGKRYCDDDSSCKQTEFCHQLISGRGVCAPKGLECQEDKDCPDIGNKFGGSVMGICGSSGGCEWEIAEIII